MTKKSHVKREDVSSAPDEDLANKCVITENRVLNTFEDPTDFASTSQIGKPFDVVKYMKGISVKVVNEDENDFLEKCLLEIDLVGIHAPIANALRRVMIAEVPTMAFDRIYLYQNTTVVQDEVLTHRIGLLPIKMNPRPFKFASEASAPDLGRTNQTCEEEPTPMQDEAVVFTLNVTCTVNKNAPAGTSIPEEKYTHSTLHSKDLEFVPIGDHAARFAERPPKMVFDDIVVAKMRPGHQVEARCHALKGIGRDHAKFSPVATAYYRMLPEIKFKSRFFDKEAETVKYSFSDGVINLIKGEDGRQEAVVVNSRADMCSRNIFRHPELAEKIEMTKKKDHFIFNIESTGALTGAEILTEACLVMEAKCRMLRSLIDQVSQEPMTVE